MCEHQYFETEYCTIVCHTCGVETRNYLKPTEGYTENVPLDPGYSRHHRMRILLKQLFNPQYYGTPNSEVSAHAIKHGPFEDGAELLQWLSRLQVKHKQYQNAHYYFAIACPNYVFPKPPNVEKVLGIERAFHTLEQRFVSRTHSYKSFFSYNWLLRKLLSGAELDYYLQFVKRIKCKKRKKTYETMWDFFKTEDNAAAIEDVSRKTQKQPAALQANVGKPRREPLSPLDLLIEIHQSMKASVT